MAIRCLELNIPAIIGIGQIEFERLKKVHKLNMIVNKKFLNHILNINNEYFNHAGCDL